MTWLTITLALLKFFGPILGPILCEWLKSLLREATDRLPSLRPADTHTALANLFAAARARTWRYTVRRALVNACEKIALARASEFAVALAGTGPAPQLSKDDAAEIAAAF